MNEEVRDRHLNTTTPSCAGLFDRVAEILDETHSHVAQTINSEMVIGYWQIGREIVEDEQRGRNTPDYGSALLQKLSQRRNSGASSVTLQDCRTFYMTYRYRLASDFHPNLSWSHYRVLMHVENDYARKFYEQEAGRNQWTKRQLKRQINTLLFERLLKSRDKNGVLQIANCMNPSEQPINIMKDPYISEFLGLPESPGLAESDLKAVLLTHLQEYLLGLDSGFAFVAREKRLTLEGYHFYADLVFYHVRLKCYVIIDLKTEKLTPGDLSQMQMFVHYYDREICAKEDNSTIGLILCSEKNDAVVEYVLGKDDEHIFASRYDSELPSEAELLKVLLERYLDNHPV